MEAIHRDGRGPGRSGWKQSYLACSTLSVGSPAFFQPFIPSTST